MLHDKVKAVVRRGRLAARRVEAQKRALPDFIIIGAQKAGTTSLYDYISQHPAVAPAFTKEIHYFDVNYWRGDLWYRSHFPLRAALRDAGQLTGEASPYYMFHPHALKRVAATLPDVKIILILRNPVDRAVSHYFHGRLAGRETLPMADAFEREEERIDAEYRRMLADEAYDSFAYRHFSYKKRGIYVDQVRASLSHFPAGRVLILKSEALRSAPEQTLRQVYGFLDIDPDFLPARLEARKVGHYSQDVPVAVVERLQAYFAPHNRRLYDLLQNDMTW